ncbi:MAG TPA: 16S rRNA (guanine(527)-N(7))-methyltransferase RsmG [Candidatus Limnocylindrales bacterium]|nr:16S rRNA (guanine(527)-N(7))-methyltransferase RsmG [Candidatus Limnocylindrales bacterium]
MDRRREPLPTRVKDTPPLPEAYDAALHHGLAALAMALSRDARIAIDGHVRLLLAWTEAINLTAIREPAAVAVGHVVDSLTGRDLIADVAPRRLLDLGSGGGFPGIPLAASLRDDQRNVDVTLLEPISKKARFLQTVVEATGLQRTVRVETARAEDLAGRPDRSTWDVVTARAVATAADLVELAFPLLAPGGTLIAWKRGDITDEVTAARRAVDALGGGSVRLVDVAAPGLDRHRLVAITRSTTGTVPSAYPRDPAVRKRRPW